MATSTLGMSLRNRIQINLLSRHSGRPYLANLAKDLALSVQTGARPSIDIDAGLIQERIEGRLFI